MVSNKSITPLFTVKKGSACKCTLSLCFPVFVALATMGSSAFAQGIGAFSGAMYHQTTTSQSAPVQASQATNAYECTQVAIEDIDPNLLTKEERIALLDGSLQDSIDQYSTCVSSVQQNMNGGGGGGGSGEGEGTGTASETSESNEQEKDEMDNTTPPSTSEVSKPTPPVKSITPAQRGVIAPKDNDKIICKLLFNEIQSINDPDMLKGLKEQYKSYKCG